MWLEYDISAQDNQFSIERQTANFHMAWEYKAVLLLILNAGQ